MSDDIAPSDVPGMEESVVAFCPICRGKMVVRQTHSGYAVCCKWCHTVWFDIPSEFKTGVGYIEYKLPDGTLIAIVRRRLA